ncbi:MAG: OmpA family protein, partial [Luteibaculum sp.]
QADLFTPESKSELASSPSNQYGKEKAYDGNNYAGIKAYVYKEKEPRNYITGTLSKKLEADKPYCVKFQQSLSEDSKYAIANLAAVLSSEEFEMGDMSYNILMEPSIQLKKPVVVTRQLYWEDVCNVYTAKGDEQFITLGTFVSEKQVEYSKVKRPSGFSGAQQSYAYYYIDNVEVTPFKEGDKCSCEKKVFVDEPKIIRATVESNVSEKEVNEEIESLVVHFGEKDARLDPNQTGVEEILKFIKLDSDLRLSIVGHISEAEMKMGMKDPRVKTLAIARAKAVQAYLIEQKVDKTKLSVEDAGSYSPVGSSKDPDFTKNNQSVTFKVKSIAP